MNSTSILKQWIFVAIFSGVPVFASQAQGNLVANGGFESGSAGWTLVRGATTTLGGHPGIAVFLGSTNASPATEPTASQMIDGVINSTIYSISGEYRAGKDRGGTSSLNQSFGVAVNGTYLFEVAASPNGNWQGFNFFYTATSSSMLLSLTSQINGTGVEYDIDNIAVRAVPEPSSLALVGLSGFFFAMRLLQHSRNSARQSTACRQRAADFPRRCARSR